ncbi:nephrin-like [Homarus americanus]|uniref:nephrin-like n=1 Tax=Homarus americanus TaxID=6706 RepID=UPI001C450493|nr:nephrin-like [Homarus americanus]
MYHPTKTTRVNLTVVVPPKRVSVVMGGHKTAPRSRSSSVVGPYLEGDTPKLTCVAYGGNPRPSVVWFEGKYLLDSFMESEVSENSIKTLDELEATTLGPGPLTLQPAYGGDPFNMLTLGPPTPRPAFEGNLYNTLMPGRPTPKPAFGGEPYNTLTLGPLSRSHLNLQLTCEASNNNITKPTTLMVIVEMNLPPLSVEILPPESKSPLMAGLQYKVECVVVGAQPPPRVSWWGGYERLLQTTKASVDAKENSAHGNVTTNRLIFTPRPEDNGSSLRCIAESRDPPVTLEDSWPLSVHYVPTARCSYGASLDSTNIKEGDDVYFECYIEANPPVTRVSWRHNDVALVHNVSAGVIVSNQSLVLQQVVRAQAGRYSCLAHNPVGDGASNSLRLDVKYAPVCSPGQVTTYAVGRYEDAEVTCSVEANPLQESFQWTFNNTADTIDVPQGRFSSSSSHSVITYTPMTALDYGTLLCWAANEIGSQREPCVFHIVPAGEA